MMVNTKNDWEIIFYSNSLFQKNLFPYSLFGYNWLIYLLIGKSFYFGFRQEIQHYNWCNLLLDWFFLLLDYKTYYYYF